VLVIALCGCDVNFKPGAESILDAVKTGPTPGEMAKMAIDPYDANARCMGTLGLAAESFASDPLYIKLFEDNLKDPDPSVRAAAARGLGTHGEPANAAALAEALSDKDRVVRLEAARGLQRIHNESVVDALTAAMKAPDPAHPREGGEPEVAVRAEAALALGQYAQTRVLETLMTGLDDPDLAVNEASLSSLRVLTGQDFGYDHGAWVDWRARTQDYFAGRGQYVYPYFHRDQRWYEYLPLVPGPPNETAGTPAGMPRS
jgi:HEAT repeat protein